MIVIPFKDLPSFIQTVTLDNIIVNFKFVWNGRDDAWVLDLSDSVNDPIINGIKLVNGWELILKYTDTRLPQGAIMVVSLKDSEEKITRYNMIDSFKLVYITEEELNGTV